MTPRYVLSPDALVRRSHGATIISNPRTRTHVELDDAHLGNLMTVADGAEEESWIASLASASGWDRTTFDISRGLWSDQTGLGPRKLDDPASGRALFELLRRRMIVHCADRSDYEAFLAPLTSVVDRKHLGTFHQRVGQYQALELRLDEKWRWWHDQKFDASGRSVRPGPYRAIQESFFDAYYHEESLRSRSVLDFACGNGYYSNKFAALGATVTGIDTNRELITLAKRNFGDRVTFYGPESNADSLSLLRAFDSASVDVVYMSDVMLILVEETIRGRLGDDLEQLLAEFHRILKPDGHLDMMEPNSQFWLGGMYGDPLRPYFIVPEYRNRVFNVAPTIDQYVAMFAESGFGLIRLLHPGIGEDEPADPELRARATAFPLWDFFSFVAR